MKTKISSTVTVKHNVGDKKLFLEIKKSVDEEWALLKNTFDLHKTRHLTIIIKHKIIKSNPNYIASCKRNRIFILLTQKTKNLYSMGELIAFFKHELVHFFHSHHRNWKKTPLWIAEGLARHLAKQKNNFDFIKKYIATNGAPSVSTLLFCSRKDFASLGGYMFAQIYIEYIILSLKIPILSLIKDFYSSDEITHNIEDSAIKFFFDEHVPTSE